MSLLNIPMLEHYAKTGRNVLFEGHRGVGKTATINQVFNGLGLKWKYFSTPTMDPWVDLVGMPKVVERDGGRKAVTDLIRPWYIEDDVYEAIFFDELNRANSKTLDAVMELIQFGSINGHKLNNLKCVWGAINPYDDSGTYQVEELDPALIDRFHCYIKVPYKLDEAYLRLKYPQIAIYFIDWWNALPADAQAKISPRRLEYLIQAHLDGGRMEDVVESKGTINIKELRDSIKTLPFKDALAQANDLEAAKAILSNGNNVTKLLDLVKKKDQAATDFFTKFKGELPQEIIAPFVEAVQATKSKAAKIITVKSFDEIVNSLPDEKADAGCGSRINEMDFRVLMSNGNTFETEIMKMHQTKPHMVRKLANRFADILISCRQDTIDRLMWGMAGRVGNRPTNFQQIVQVLVKMHHRGDAWTSKQYQHIQGKYDRAMEPAHGMSNPSLVDMVNSRTDTSQAYV
jgi:hypothetical protein